MEADEGDEDGRSWRDGGMRRRTSTLVLGFAALPAVAGFVLLVAQALSSPARGAETERAAAPPALGAVPVSTRFLCSFANEDARAALITGADGGTSVPVGGRDIWLFGDTIFDGAAAGKEIEQNSVAWSSGTRPDGCPRLTYYAKDGIGVPFLPKDGSLTNWPGGSWPVDGRYLDIYVTYTYGTGPYGYWIGEIGVSRLDTQTMQVEMLSRSLWNADSGFRDQIFGAQPVEVGDDGLVRVVLETKASEKLLARVPPGQFDRADAYEFWTGSGWSRSPADAAPLWDRPHPTDPLEKLATFENTANIAWNSYLQRYVAVLNMGGGTVGARTAPRLEGPWSDPVPWLDCSAIAGPDVPTCYSPAQHPELSTDGGRTLVLTFTRLASYDVAAVEIRLGAPVHEYRRGDDRVEYGLAAPGSDFEDRGVAFYASADPLPGFQPVYRWERQGEVAYDAVAPEPGFVAGTIAFYAPAAPQVAGSLTTFRPVYEWRSGSLRILSAQEGLEQYGFTRGRVAFYTP